MSTVSSRLLRKPSQVSPPNFAPALGDGHIARRLVRVVLVCGAGGELGGRVVRRLAGGGVALRVLVRGDPPARLEAEVVRGDLRDPASVATAVQGVTTVVTT